MLLRMTFKMYFTLQIVFIYHINDYLQLLTHFESLFKVYLNFLF